MLLELKKIKDHLQFQLRKLLREARKADLDIYCLSTGYLEEKLQFSQANIGPWALTRKINLNIYLLKGEQYSLKSFTINPKLDLDTANILSDLQQNKISYPLPNSPNGVGQHFDFKHIGEKGLDEHLLSIDHQECSDFFRSRFLIDAPRKVLYEGTLTRGVSFQVYMDEYGPFVYHAHSYYRVVGNFRSKEARFRIDIGGQDLRSMRLSRIRPLCQPFWSSVNLQVQKEEWPKDIMFNAKGVTKILEATLQAHNHHLKSENNQENRPLAQPWRGQHEIFLGLVPSDNPLLKPICQVIARELQHQTYPDGNHDQQLHHLIEGRLQRQALYLQNILVQVSKDRFHVSSLGSSLLIHPGGRTSILNEPISLHFSLEELMKAQTGNQQTFIPKTSTKTVISPDHILLKNIDIQIH